MKSETIKDLVLTPNYQHSKPCNGDPNTIVKECPLPCPATCDAPNAMPCKKQCEPISCECREGFVLSKSCGQCVRPEKCKGGNPCDGNETFAPCKVSPSDYCLVINSPNRVVCETPRPCYPGCVSYFKYRRRSVTNPRCMLASECPELKCDKYEEWSGFSSACLAEDCDNVNAPPVTCNTLLLNCQPKCICKKGYFRDRNRICVPAKQCPTPICNDPNEVFDKCPPTCPPGDNCSNLSSKFDCSKFEKRCKPQCRCKPGYLRMNGKCIPSKLCSNIHKEDVTAQLESSTTIV